jgi:hypothetical protein
MALCQGNKNVCLFTDCGILKEQTEKERNYEKETETDKILARKNIRETRH